MDQNTFVSALQETVDRDPVHGGYHFWANNKNYYAASRGWGPERAISASSALLTLIAVWEVFNPEEGGTIDATCGQIDTWTVGQNSYIWRKDGLDLILGPSTDAAPFLTLPGDVRSTLEKLREGHSGIHELSYLHFKREQPKSPSDAVWIPSE